MSETAGQTKPEAASAPADPFGPAKANLRETVKWLATALAAVVPAILAGASLTGLGALSPNLLVLALAGCGFGLLCLFHGIGIVFELLTSEVFTFGEIQNRENKWLQDWLDARANDFIPPGYETIEQLSAKRDAWIAKVHHTTLSPTPTEGEIKDAETALGNLKKLAPHISRITSLAHLLLLRKRLLDAGPRLMFFALGTIAGFGAVAWTAGYSKEQATNSATPVVKSSVIVDMGSGWDKLAATLKESCGEGTSLKAAVVGQPASGWLEIEVAKDHPKCAGVRFSLTGELAVQHISIVKESAPVADRKAP
jgi:hypothetical protein